MNSGNRVLLVVLLILIAAHGSDASMFGKIRKLIESRSNENQVQMSPSPSPNDMNGGKADKESSKDVHKPANPPEPAGSLTNDRCKISLHTCHDQGDLTACLQFSGLDPEEISLIIQNDGESILKVKATSSSNISLKEIQIPEHKAKKINLVKSARSSLVIELTAGNGSCVIHMGASKSEGSFFDKLPSYAIQVTPIHGAYVLSFTVLIIGGIWACCKCRSKGRTVDGVPYQELEMGQPDSVSAKYVETAEGWDESWGDDWDEEEAITTPGGNHEPNVSVNGLNSRSRNKDGWGNDWDD